MQGFNEKTKKTRKKKLQFSQEMHKKRELQRMYKVKNLHPGLEERQPL